MGDSGRVINSLMDDNQKKITLVEYRHESLKFHPPTWRITTETDGQEGCTITYSKTKLFLELCAMIYSRGSFPTQVTVFQNWKEQYP